MIVALSYLIITRASEVNDELSNFMSTKCVILLLSCKAHLICVSVS